MAQQLTLGGGYQYLYSSEWDNAMQRYNFNRSFTDEAQPLLIHSTFIETAYFFASDRKTHSGVKLDYGFSRSNASNTESDLSFHLHLINLGYSFQYSFNYLKQQFYLETDVAFSTALLNKRIDGEIEVIDDEASRATEFGGKVALSLFYVIPINSDRQLAPFIGMAYAPYFGSESEFLIDQTISPSSASDIKVLSVKVGVRYTFLRE